MSGMTCALGLTALTAYAKSFAPRGTTTYRAAVAHAADAAVGVPWGRTAVYHRDRCLPPLLLKNVCQEGVPGGGGFS